MMMMSARESGRVDEFRARNELEMKGNEREKTTQVLPRAGASNVIYLDEIVQREIAQHDAADRVEDGKKRKHHPVGQPLLVVRGIRTFDCLE